MRFCFLGSGSKGNAAVVNHGDTSVLLDCGFHYRDLVSRLEQKGMHPKQISAVALSHEHGDHVRGLKVFLKNNSVPVYATSGTIDVLGLDALTHKIRAGETFNVGDIALHAYKIPHDAREPVQFVIQAGGRQLGVITDAGWVATDVKKALEGSDSLVIECNYDRDMLEVNQEYPVRVKQRIAGNLGHLSNESASYLAGHLNSERKLTNLVAAHLSENNNTEDLAYKALFSTVNPNSDTNVIVASQQSGCDWLSI